MGKETINFRTEADRIKTLDAVATALDRDRTYVINEAISTYLEIHQWQIDHIKEGIRQADAGDFATDAEVAAAFKKRKRQNRGESVTRIDVGFMIP